MQMLPLSSRIILYILLALFGILGALLWIIQVSVMRGRAFHNPDGSRDDWHEQKTFYGIAFADVFVACPVNLLGVALVFVFPRWGFYLLALASFWWVWANVMTTATSLRFYRPRQHWLLWLFTYPFGALLGAAYIAWTVVHFDWIYAL